MNSKKRVHLTVGVAVILLCWMTRIQWSEEALGRDSKGYRGSPVAELSPPPPLNRADLEASPLSPEVRSLQVMTYILAQSLQPNMSLEQIVVMLKDFRLGPQIYHSSNPDTGSVILVQTDSPPAGTRNFEAQYFASEDGSESSFDRVSFEFRPGPTAINEAIEAIRKNFPGIGDPKEHRTGDLDFALPNGYVVSLRRLTLDDIHEANPDRAYEEADVGTIRVSLFVDEHEEE